MDRATSGTRRPIVALALLVLWMAALGKTSAAEQTWQQALGSMALPSPSALLNRDNAIEIVLNAFRSNGAVKAIVVLPGVVNDFYLINRDQPKLNLRATNLLQAVNGLTNATAVRATFAAPLLLLHLDRELLSPQFSIQDDGAADQLRKRPIMPHVLCCDMHWERLQPNLEKCLSRPIRPGAQSTDAWHFERHNLAGWGLSGWELLTAVALAGKTSFSVQKQAISFHLRANR